MEYDSTKYVVWNNINIGSALVCLPYDFVPTRHQAITWTNGDILVVH